MIPESPLEALKAIQGDVADLPDRLAELLNVEDVNLPDVPDLGANAPSLPGEELPLQTPSDGASDPLMDVPDFEVTAVPVIEFPEFGTNASGRLEEFDLGGQPDKDADLGDIAESPREFDSLEEFDLPQAVSVAPDLDFPTDDRIPGVPEFPQIASEQSEPMPGVDIHLPGYTAAADWPEPGEGGGGLEGMLAAKLDKLTALLTQPDRETGAPHDSRVPVGPRQYKSEEGF